MSDRRHRSTPPALPEGYQYGDARPRLAFHRDAFASVCRGETCALCGGDASWCIVLYQWVCPKCGARWLSGVEAGSIHSAGAGKTGDTITTSGWRAPHENAAAQLKRREVVSTPLTRSYDTEFDERGPISRRTGDEAV